MVETALVILPLTRTMIEQGRVLVKALERNGVTIVSAFWFLNIESGTYKLYVVSPQMDSPHSRQVRDKAFALRQTFSDDPEGSPWSVGLLSPTESRARLVRGLVTTGPDEWIERRYTNAVSEGQVIDDVYIYRQTLPCFGHEPEKPLPRVRKREAAGAVANASA